MNVKNGTIITLTKGYAEWTSEMDKYVGEQVRISSFYKGSLRSPNGKQAIRVAVRPLNDDEFPDHLKGVNDYDWRYNYDHFLIGRHTVKKPLVLSGTFKEFLESIAEESSIARIIIRTVSRKNNRRWNIIDKVITTEQINFLTMRSNGMLSYMPSNKKQGFNDNREWMKEGRQEGKPSRVIRKIFTPNALKFFKESDFEIFNNKYNARFNTDAYKFEVLPSSKISYVYNDMERKEGGAGLNGSCMNGTNYQEMFDQCDNLRIVTLTTPDNKLAGRALLWNALVTDTKYPITLLDRIYVSDDILYEKFIAYAKENDWWTKVCYRNRDCPSYLVSPTGEKKDSMYLSVKCNQDGFDYYPYIDTFAYGDGSHLYNFGEGEWRFTYNSTGGEREDSENNGTWYDDIECCSYDNDTESIIITAGSSRYRDQTTRYSNAVCINNDWYYREDSDYVCYSEFHCEWLLKDDDDVAWSDIENDYLKTDSRYVVYVESLSEYAIKDNCYEVDGEIYHESQVTKL